MTITENYKGKSGVEYVFEYSDADSFDMLDPKLCRQAYGVCLCGDKMVIGFGGNKKDWGLIGGTIELGETFEETLAREIQEESNMEVLKALPVGYQKVTDTRDGSFFYQLRYVCTARPYGPFVSDPAGGVTEIKLINPKEYKQYFDWGKIGERIISRALELQEKISDNIPEFGIKRENEERRDGGCAVVFDPQTKKFAVGRQEDGKVRLFSGGVELGESMEEGVLREVREEGGLYDFLHVEKVALAFTHYRNTLKNVNRVAFATCFLVILKSSNLVDTKLEEHEKFVLDWVSADEIVANWQARNQNKDYDHWIYFFGKALARIRELGYTESF